MGNSNQLPLKVYTEISNGVNCNFDIYIKTKIINDEETNNFIVRKAGEFI